MHSSFSDKGVNLIPACFRVPEFGNSPERERWQAGLFFVSLAQTPGPDLAFVSLRALQSRRTRAGWLSMTEFYRSCFRNITLTTACYDHVAPPDPVSVSGRGGRALCLGGYLSTCTSFWHIKRAKVARVFRAGVATGYWDLSIFILQYYIV
jgi:hypothetical protein